MECTRHSSQPATVDLVRADLAEIWTIDDPGVQSPKRPPSVSGVSDMLDLEFLPTPGLRPSKLRKKDPLQDILDDFLELSPSPKGRSGCQEKLATNIDSSERGNDRISPNAQHRNQSDRNQGRAGGLSDANTHSANSADPDSPLGGTRKLGAPARLELTPSKANKRRCPDRKTATAESPVDSPVPKSRRQRKSNGKTVSSSTARKQPSKVSKQPKTVSPATNPAPTQTKTKERGSKLDDDWFELSDKTDTEEEPRPKKRQTKQLSPKEPVAPSSRRDRPSKEVSFPVRQGNKPTRLFPKRLNRVAHQEDKAEGDPTYFSPAAHADDDEQLDAGSYQLEVKTTSTVTKSNPDEHQRIDYPVPAVPNTNILETFACTEPPRPLRIATREGQPVLQAPPETQDVIILSSESPEASDAFVGSTSPLFMEQDQTHEAEKIAPTLAISASPANFDQRPPIQQPINRERLGSTPPRSFQPRHLDKSEGKPRGHRTELRLPINIRNEFFFDEQPAAISPSSSPGVGPCSEKESLRPEDVWKQAVENDSPPAILQRIVNLLHRSLKPREDILRDIATDYRENALRLLGNLVARHSQEKSDTLASIRKTSRTAFSVFSIAGQDVAILIDSLRNMDFTHTANTPMRPALAEKLDVAVRLCQTKLSSYVRGEPLENVIASEAEDALDSLADNYYLKLAAAVRKSDDKLPSASAMVDSEVEGFMQRCLYGETEKARHTEARKPNNAGQNVDETLEVFLDGIINTLQNNGNRDGFGHSAAGDVVNVVSENSTMADMGFLG